MSCDNSRGLVVSSALTKLMSACLTTSASYLMLTTAVVAQSSQDQQTSSQQASLGQGAKLETVIVTAQKRSENLQTVSISAQVIGNDQITVQNHVSAESLSQTVPGLHIVQGIYSDSINLRGVGSGVNGFFDQSVATFVDDIYQGRSRMTSAAFLDIDHIEVLKGPQSTFFGNNAIAGALNIVTKKPGDQFEAKVRGLYGMFGQYSIEGEAGGPITDDFGFRVAAIFDGTGGWIENVTDNNRRMPITDNKAGRMTFTYSPRDDLDVTLKVGASEGKTSGAGYDPSTPSQSVYCSPPAPLTAAFVQGCAQLLASGLPMNIKGDKTSGVPVYTELSTFEDVLTVDYRNWGHTFTSVTGFNNYHSHSLDSAGLLPTPITTVDTPEKYNQFSQEFRVASPTNQTVEYLAGLYFQTDALHDGFEANAPVASAAVTHNPALAPLIPYLPPGFILTGAQAERVYSAFGSVTWNITDSLRLIGGLRSSWVNKSFVGSVVYGTTTQIFGGEVPIPAALQPLEAFFYGPPGGQSLKRQDYGFMPSGGIQYQITPDTMAYFSYSRGFKAGGFNGNNPNDPPQEVLFGPEHVNAYEAGIKSQWLNDTLRLNADVFRSDYSDLQVNESVFNQATGTRFLQVANVASSVAQGVEFEGQWAANDNIRLGANISYLDSHYVSFPNATQGSLGTFCSTLSAATFAATPLCSSFGFPVPAVQSLAGQRTNFAPAWSGSLSADYTVSIPNDFVLTAELSPYFTSNYYAPGAQGNDPFLLIPGYVRLDARVTVETLDGHWAFDLIGKNLTNRIILTTLALGYEAKEEPLNAAFQIRYKW